jgi:hypothetical protein
MARWIVRETKMELLSAAKIAAAVPWWQSIFSSSAIIVTHPMKMRTVVPFRWAVSDGT